MSGSREPPAAAVPAHRRGGRSRRFKLALLAFMLSPFVLPVYGYNVERNLRARGKVRESCAAIDRGVAQWLQVPVLRPFFLDDAEVVRDDLRATLRGNCAALDAQLAWWRFNLKRSMRMPGDPRRAARLDRALERAKARCPAAVRELYAELFRDLRVGDEERARAETELCGLFRSAPRLAGGPSTEREIWAWADDYARIGEIVARHQSGAPLGTPLANGSGAPR